MTFEVTILGSNSALPAHGRHPTSQIVNYNDRLFLVDCGEAAQIQLSRYKIRTGKIEHIFISHMHGDHYFGLIGLITSYNLNQRSIPLHIHGPEGLQQIIELQLHYSNTTLVFPLHFHVVKPESGALVYEDEQMKVTSVEMIHRIPCSGYVFTEKINELNVRKEKLDEYNIPYTAIASIKKGKDWTSPDGTTIANSELTLPRPKERSYAFCTDTLYTETILPYIKDVELLYHEATFDASRADRAVETFHTTSVGAADIAKKANAGQLIIGHFSSRYREPEMAALLKESQSVFPNTALAIEGTTFEVKRK